MRILRRRKKAAVRSACRHQETSLQTKTPLLSHSTSWFALEPRIMFDGAGIATLSTVATDSLVQNQTETLSSPEDVTVGDAPPDAAPTGEPQFSSSDQALFDALAAYDTSAARQEIVFLSPSVRDYQQLLDGISPNVEVFVLDPTRDGVQQMAEALAGRTGIDAIHLIGDGTEAEMHLGASFLTQDSISTRYAEQFQQIGQSLSADADLLIYGCNFGRGDAGQLAINTLATLTGADVAASIDRTGSAAEHANWQLEVTTGAIETSVVIAASTQEAWNHALATFTVTTTLDVVNAGDGLTSLREAIIAANNTAGADTIILGAGTYTLTITGTGEDGSATGDLDIQTNVTITGAGMGSTIINGGSIDRVMEVDGTGNLTMSDVRLTGGSINNDGGALLIEEVGGTATLTRVDITGNTITGGGRFGGGVHNVGTLIMDSSLVRGNTATGSDGGGISNIGTATITRSSIFNNTARYGGGIHQSSGTMTVENTTLSGNTASLEGGGVDVAGGAVTLRYSTIAVNTSSNGPGGGANLFSGTLTILSSIFADNSSTTGGRDLRGAVSSSGFNIIEHNTGFSGTVGTDQLSSDPLLAALALDASSGQYVHRLNTGSIAINTAGGTVPSTDQRGFLRTGTADVGAFEVTSGPAITTSFQNGDANGYSSNVDTYVDAGNVTANNATNVDLQVDLDDGAGDPTTQTLIRFDDLFGTGPGQIPYGSYITSASLTVNVNNVSDPGATIGLHAMLSSWTDTSNWSSLSGGVSTNGVEAAVTADSVLASPAATGSVTFTGLASRLQSWVSGGSANQGWVVVSNSTNGWDFDSSESANKPLLSVTYIAPGSQTSVAHSLTVDTAADILDGDATSIDALLANKGADGLISLREAIHAANNTANDGGADQITFAIGTGLQTIAVGPGGLPDISDAVILDATTQPGYGGTPLIQLDGTGATGATAGLRLQTSDSTVRGFIIHSFPDEGIEVDGSATGGLADDNIIENNWVGINSTGTAASNADNGILLTDGASSNQVRNNVIAGNTNNGLVIRFAGTDNNIVEGNRIGVLANGTTVVANVGGGIEITGGAQNNRIGGTGVGAGNVISGNGNDGIVLWDATTTGNVIQGNFIGTDTTGTMNLGNSQEGIQIGGNASSNTIGGTGANEGNTIAFNGFGGFNWDGVAIAAGSTGIGIYGNDIYGNAGLGIDLNDDGVTVNDGTVTVGQPNLLMDHPVFTSVQLVGTTLTVSGYIGIAPGDTDFANARVEIFRSSSDVTGFGEGQTYLGFLTANASGNFSGSLTVAGLTAADRVTGTATDGSNNTSEFGANFEVNGPPVVDLNAGGAGQDVTTAFTEQTPALIAPVGTVTDADSANLSSLTVTLTARPDGDGVESLSLNGAATTAASGAGLTVSYTAGTGVLSITGSATTAVYQTVLQGILYNNTSDTPTTTNRSITVVANDGALPSATQTVTLTVTAQNDPPDIVDATVAVDENSANGTAVTNISDSFTGTDFDRDGEAITYSITAGNTGGAFAIDVNTGAITVATSAALDFETTPSFTLTVQASDGTQSDTAAITINLNNLNDNAPNIVDATVAVDENSANGTAVTNVNDSFTGTDFDRDGEAITYSITAGNTGGAFAINAATGAITVATSAALDFETTPSFTLTVQASDGTQSDTAAITINLNNLNEPPVAGDDVAVTTENTAVTTGNVLANDSDVDSVLSPASITAFDVVSVNGGTVVNNGDGTFTYTPGTNFTGIDTFTYTVSDGLLSDTATVTITVTPAGNSAPSLTANTGATVTQGLTDVITASELQVLDLDNSPGQLVYTVTTVPADGQLELTTAPGVAITTFTQADIDAGRVVFVHSGAAATSDSFTFTVSDGAGGTIGATTFTFTVAPFIPPPGGGGGSGGSGGGGGGTGGSGGTGSGSGSGSGGSGGIVPPPIQPPPVLIGVGVPVKEMSVVGATNDPLPRTMTPNRTFARVEQPTVGIQEPPAGPVEPFSLPVKKVLAVGHKLVEHLTKLADDLERGVQEREHKTQLIGQVASFSGMALSAGFVAWILRGGALVASFLVSMPAWRHFDPLPVLGMGEGDRRKRDRKIREEDEQEKKQFRGIDQVLKSSNGRQRGK